MRILVRVDTAPHIGGGHLMRCLTLAGELQQAGCDVLIVVRNRPALDLTPVRKAGFDLQLLPQADPATTLDDDGPPHQAWLGVTQEEDYEQTAAAMSRRWPRADRVVVDHYGVDARWETLCRGNTDRILVIDDLADRDHDCDVLLDQTFGRKATDYANRVPSGCRFLIGADYALLRPEFARLRPEALARRNTPQADKILISFGGYDPDNATSQVLRELEDARESVLTVKVILGPGAPHLGEVNRLCRDSYHDAALLTGVADMARHMTDTDISIGSGGTVAWERCCLGLPSLVITTASNQELIARCLAEAGAIDYLGSAEAVGPGLIHAAFCAIKDDAARRSIMAGKAASIVDGRGAGRVAKELVGEL